jgi:hypothetical protein
VKVSLIGDGALDAFTATFLAATAFFAGAFFAATFLVGTGAAAFLATFFAEVGMFLLPVVVSELLEAHTACARFNAGFYKRQRDLRDSFVYQAQGLLRGADSATHFDACFSG